MKYYLNTEFLDGRKTIRIPFTNIKIGSTKTTVDLIYINIVEQEEATKEYYAVSKGFNLKEAWNNKWLRDNVLNPIYFKLYWKENKGQNVIDQITYSNFTYKELKRLIGKYGKTRKKIAEEVKDFVYSQETSLMEKQNCLKATLTWKTI